jgi:phosphoglucosamine mutase
VIDCAHGATYQVGPKIFNELGAEVIAIGVSPDGSNINQDCGSTDLDLLITEVRKNKADLGIAFDGDGDRVLMVSAQGQIIDGDQLLYIIVKAELISGSFQGGVVGTLMTNLAMEENLKANHVLFERSKVGDRYVSELMEERHWDYGGENSGHILLKKHHSTGDGIISALQVLKAIQQRQISFDEAVAEIELYPQILLNIATNEAVNLDAEHVQEAIKNAEKIMHDQGRVLLRKSGTEAKIRIMTECADRDLAMKAAEAIKKTIFG